MTSFSTNGRIRSSVFRHVNDPLPGCRMLTLHEACNMIDRGVRFGDVYAFLEDQGSDGPQLRYYFTHKKLPEPKTCADEDTPAPVMLPRSKKPHSMSLTSLNGVTGEVCPQCQGSNVVRDGKCSKCMDCYLSLGNCS